MHTFVAQDAAVRQAWFLAPQALLRMLHCLSREAFHLERKTCKMHFWDVTAKDVFVQAVVKCCLCLGCCCTQRLPTRWPCTSNIGSVHEHTEIISWPWISLSVVNKPSFPQFTQGKLEVIWSSETGQSSYIKISCLFYCQPVPWIYMLKTLLSPMWEL